MDRETEIYIQLARLDSEVKTIYHDNVVSPEESLRLPEIVEERKKLLIELDELKNSK